MKKISFILAALLLLGSLSVFAGCGKTEKETGKESLDETLTEKMSETEKETEAETEAETVHEVLYSDRNADKVITEKMFEFPEQFSKVKNELKFRLDNIFGNQMCLQALMPCRLFGTYKYEGQYVAARVKNNDTGDTEVYYGKAADDEFEIWLPAHEYGGNYTIEIIDESGMKFMIKNVTFGEVWLCGGQSNMGWNLSQCYDGDAKTLLYADDIANAENENIRINMVYPVSARKPSARTGNVTQWTKFNKNSVGSFSACAFFFGRELQSKIGVPVGLVQSCMGGTHISTWMPETGEWYNAMIHVLRKMTFRGVLWYQGENDPQKYAERLADLINAWREEFDNPDMLFHVVQLPRYVNEGTYFSCREEDKKVCSLVPYCTYSVNIDTGMLPHMAVKGDTLNADAIHPYQKKEVGERAADVVAGTYYGVKGLYSSPYMVSCELQSDNSITVTFDNVGDGLMLQGLAGFQVYIGKSKWLDAKPTLIDKNKISLTFEGADGATAQKLRYGYSNSSSFIENKHIKDCAECVCVYNTKDGGVKAYPAEQFDVNFGE